jgi:two-component system sensor histidine kinase QseC
MTAAFQLEGQDFIALNGGPIFTFTEAISFVINCETQDEVDHYWDKLSSDGGTTSQCGWLKDKFGLSWQVVPTILTKLAGNSDKKKVGSMMQVMMKMTKLDIKILQEAFDKG